MERRGARSAAVCGRPSMGGRCGAGWSRRTSAHPPVSPSSRSSRGWVGVHRPRSLHWPTGPPGAGPGRPPSFCGSRPRRPSSARCPPAALARAAAATDGAPTRGAAALALVQLELAQPGVTIVRQPPVTDPIDLVLSVVGDPVRARPRRQRPGARPVLGLGGAAHGAAGAPGVPDGRNLGAGAGGLAGRGRQPGRRLGSRAAAGGGRRSRCARRRLSGGERADLQRGGRPARAGPPRGGSLRSRHTRAAGGAGRPHRAADDRALAC